MTKKILTITLFIFLTKGLFGQDSLGYIKIYALDRKTNNAILDTFTVNLIDNESKSTVYRLQPNKDGYVEIKYLLPNKYRSVSLSVTGYKTLEYKKVIVDGIHTTYLNFPLTSISEIKTNKNKRKQN